MRFLIAWGLLFAACYRDPRVRTAASAPSSALEIKSLRGPDYRGTIADPLGFLPLDAEVILGLDGEQLRASELWRQLEPAVLAKLGPELASLKARCKLDPVKSIRSLAVAVNHASDASPDGVVVVRGLDRERLMACLSDAKRSAHVRIDGEVVVVDATPDANHVVFRFVDRATLVGVVGPTATKARLARVLGGGAPLRSSPAFEEMLSLVDTSGALWALINGSSKIFDKLGAIGIMPKALFGSLSLVDGLALNLRIRLGSAAEATQRVGQAQAQLGGVTKMFFDRLEITADDVDVVVALAMTNQQIQSLLGMFGGVLGVSPITP